MRSKFSLIRNLRPNFFQPQFRTFSNFIKPKPIPAFFITTLPSNEKPGSILHNVAKEFNLPKESAQIIKKDQIDQIKSKSGESPLVVIFDHGKVGGSGHLTQLGDTYELIKKIFHHAGHPLTIIAFSCSSAAIFRAGTLDKNISLLTLTGDKEIISNSMAEYYFRIIAKFLLIGASPRQICAALVRNGPDVMYFEDNRIKSSGNYDETNPYHPKKAGIIGGFTSKEIEETVEEVALPENQAQNIINSVCRRRADVWQYHKDYYITNVRTLLTSSGLKFDPKFFEALNKKLEDKLSWENISQHQDKRARELFPDVFAELENPDQYFSGAEFYSKQQDNQNPFLTCAFNMFIRRRDTEHSVQTLIKLYPELTNNKNKSGYTNLGISILFGHPEVSKILLNAGADINNVVLDPKKTETALMIAVRARNTNIVKFILEMNPSKEFIDKQNHEGHTALMYAILKDYLEIVKLILPLADINLKTREGTTALDLAYNVYFSKSEAEQQEMPIVDLLVMENIKRTPGKSPKGISVKKEQKENEETMEL